MSIKIRPESFGLIAFDTTNRKHVFIKTESSVTNYDIDKIRSLVAQKFNYQIKNDHFQMVGGRQAEGLSAPLCLYLEITERCNLSCAHCYKPAELPHDAMAISNFYELLEECRDMGVFEVRLCGNEPAVSPFFEDVCRKIRSLDLYLSINTSGNLDSQLRSKIIDSKPNHVVVSLDGIRETHDAVRTLGAYDKAVNLLQLLKESNIPRRINSVISICTIDHIDKVVSVAKEVNSGISFIPLRTMGRATSFKKSSALTKKSMYEAVRRITQLKQDVPDVPVETFFDILGNGFLAHHTMDFNIPCPAGKNGFVAVDGMFYPCDWIRHLGKTYQCGDVRDNGLCYIWNNSKSLKNFRSIERKTCQKCKHYLNRCYGGCWCSYKNSMQCGDYEDKLCFQSIAES